MASEMVGAPAARSRCAAGPSRRPSEWMIERMQPFRRAGRHLSAHDVLGDGAGCAGLSRPDHPLRVEALRQFNDADGGRRRALLLPALLLAGLGHRHRRLRAGAEPIREHPALRTRGRLAAGAGSPPQGRLVGEAAQHRALRLGLRIHATSFIRISTTPPWCCWR